MGDNIESTMKTLQADSSLGGVDTNPSLRILAGGAADTAATFPDAVFFRPAHVDKPGAHAMNVSVCVDL